MRIFKDAASAADILKRGRFDDASRAAAVREIVQAVKVRGDEALFAYCEKFDGSALNAQTVAVSAEEIAAAYKEVDEKLLTSLKKAVKNVYEYHARSLMKEDVRTVNGRTTGYAVRPVQRAGIYVPGGTAPLVSSVLMGVLPAKAAGVAEIYVCTPAKNGKVSPAVIVAAAECGVTKLFKAGGAQAIAAMAYGTESIPAVDKIVGPGNVYVATAKKLVQGVVGIDMIAGPSEILVVADSSANADWLAADLLSQAEHDKLASAIMITDSKELASAVSKAVDRRLEALPRREIAAESIKNNGKIILTDSIEEAAALSDKIAPEHLELAVKEPEKLLKSIQNAGSVFLGHYTPEAVGDYMAGSNHTLPTGGTARFSSPLGVDDFLKKSQFIKMSPEALQNYVDDIAAFAESEGLRAHAESVRARFIVK